jgi:SapC
MPNYVVLNTESHRNLSVITEYSNEYGDNTSNIMTFPTEFGDVQSEYPILFRKNPESGEFSSFAMLGFGANENLFLNDKKWSARYVPAAIAKGPFLIGFQNQEAIGKSKNEPVINIDMEDPRVSYDNKGERLFDEEEKQTPYVEKMITILSGIHQGIEFSKLMFEAFIEHDLIEPVTIDVQFNNGEKVQLQGCYTVHEEKLKSLSGQALEKLNQSGFLQAAFLVIASLNNIKKLVDMKNQKLV